MKVLERVGKDDQVSDDMQFGFMPGKGTTDAIFIMQQVQKRDQARKNKYFLCILDVRHFHERRVKN